VPLAVCATPIGNLEDVTLRVLGELAEADLVLCEDTRRTRALLARHGISARLAGYREHNEAKRTAELLPRLEAGERMALVSDAGLPGISDPGARLVAAARDAGVPVTVLPGPSAVETALTASGFSADRYRFLGFLPRGEKALGALWQELGAWPSAVVAFESPQRLPTTLRSLASALPDRPAAVCRELTKAFEEVVRGTTVELTARFPESPKGEITLVLGPVGAGSVPARVRPDGDEAVAAVAELLGAGLPRRQAVDVVARLTGQPRNRLYRVSLRDCRQI
jgi:16S rRNA (cytidine1402-2'-O)-methyltransferase